jgi:beta-phosphoglucomutase-like phosphatase (HAD superfamily)
VKKLRIIVDLDNTLADEFGREVRPGMIEFLEHLSADGHELILWTSSTGERARRILAEHDLKRHFARFIYREDYDYGLPKDLDEIDAQLIIDDDPAQIAAAEASGADGFLITPYRGGPDPNPGELDYLYKQIHRLARRGFWRWFGR